MWISPSICIAALKTCIKLRQSTFWDVLNFQTHNKRTKLPLTEMWLYYILCVWVWVWVCVKLMQLDQLLVWIRFKSDLNCLLIIFYDPIPVVRCTRRNDLIRIRTIYIKNSLIYIKNWLNVIENGLKWMYFVVLVVVFEF